MNGRYQNFLSIFQVFRWRIEHGQINFRFYFFQWLLSCNWTSVRNVFSDMFLDNIACLVQSPLFTLSHINDSEAFFSYTNSSQFIEIFLFNTTMSFLFSDRRSNLLTGTKVVKANQCFKQSFAMRKKRINNEPVKINLSAYCMEALVFAIWSCSLKIGHDHIIKNTGLVLSDVKLLFYGMRYHCVWRLVGVGWHVK